MEQQSGATDLEKYVSNLEKTLGPDRMILKINLKNNTDITQSIGLEPEGNIENLASGAKIELVVVMRKANPQLDILFLPDDLLWIIPDYHGAIFQDGKGIM